MRKILLLVTLAAILLGLRALSQAAADWHYVVSGEPGEVLYADAFDGPTDDWTLYEGRLSAQVQDSALRIAVDAPGSLPFSTASPYFSDFDLQVQARAVAGPPDDPLNNGFGVVFRVQNPQNYYLFMISSDGYYRVQRAVDGEEKVLSDWVPSPLVAQGLDAENWLRVTATGDTFHFYVNGQPVELCIPDDPDALSTYADRCVDGQMQPALVDDSIAYGQLGVIARSFDYPGVEVDFDNVLVTGPYTE